MKSCFRIRSSTPCMKSQLHFPDAHLLCSQSMTCLSRQLLQAQEQVRWILQDPAWRRSVRYASVTTLRAHGDLRATKKKWSASSCLCCRLGSDA